MRVFALLLILLSCPGTVHSQDSDVISRAVHDKALAMYGESLQLSEFRRRELNILRCFTEVALYQTLKTNGHPGNWDKDIADQLHTIERAGVIGGQPKLGTVIILKKLVDHKGKTWPYTEHFQMEVTRINKLLKLADKQRPTTVRLEK